MSWLQNQTKHEEEEKLKAEKMEKEKLIEDLTFSAEGEADVIVQMHENELAEKRRMAKETEEAEEEERRGGGYGTSLQLSSSDTILTHSSVDATAVGDPFVYAPLELRLQGPPMPASGSELRHFARMGLEPPPPLSLIGGGFHAEIAVARALTDAFSGLYLFGPAVEKRRKKDVSNASTTAAATTSDSQCSVQASSSGPDILNESSVMETSMMTPGDASVMDVSLMNCSRMSVS